MFWKRISFALQLYPDEIFSGSFVVAYVSKYFLELML